MKILDFAHNLIRDENALRLVEFDLFLRHPSLYIVDQKPYNFVDGGEGGGQQGFQKIVDSTTFPCVHLYFYKKKKT